MTVAPLAALVPTAHADPSPPTYTVTNLGSGNTTFTAANGSVIPFEFAANQENQILSASANGSPIVSVSNGQTVYPFSLSPETTALNPYQTNIPVPVPVPYGGNSSENAKDPFSVALQPIMNANGIVVAVNASGVNDLSSDVAYYVQHNPNGSWGSPMIMWSGDWPQYGVASVAGLSVTGLNNLNQVLGQMAHGGVPYQGNNLTDTVLYNINSHTLINLSNSPAVQGYYVEYPLAIDDQGRILLEVTQGNNPHIQDTLLLTPDGVSSDPIILSAPEPGSWAVMALAVAAFAMHRTRERRRCQKASPSD